MKALEFLQDYWGLLLLMWIAGDYIMGIARVILNHKELKREIKYLKRIIEIEEDKK